MIIQVSGDDDDGQRVFFVFVCKARQVPSSFPASFPGYGCSTGRPSEKNLYADITAAFETLKTKFGT